MSDEAVVNSTTEEMSLLDNKSEQQVEDTTSTTSVSTSTNETTEPSKTTEEPTTTQEDNSTIGQVLSSLTTPGVNSGMIKATNYTFAGLFLSLLFLLYASEVDINVIFLLAIAIGLFLSVQWFLSVLAEAKAEQALAESKKNDGDNSSGDIDNKNDNKNETDDAAGVSSLVDKQSTTTPVIKKKKSQKLD